MDSGQIRPRICLRRGRYRHARGWQAGFVKAQSQSKLGSLDGIWCFRYTERSNLKRKMR
jgi:hypothetical protein